MITDSRKVQRDNYAHHRAHLLFSGLSQDRATQVRRPPALSGADLSSLTASIRAGLIGFSPTSVPARRGVVGLGDA